jgi:hypothetical protein
MMLFAAFQDMWAPAAIKCFIVARAHNNNGVALSPTHTNIYIANKREQTRADTRPDEEEQH